jgi:hypothetical protein
MLRELKGEKLLWSLNAEVREMKRRVRQIVTPVKTAAP